MSDAPDLPRTLSPLVVTRYAVIITILLMGTMLCILAVAITPWIDVVLVPCALWLVVRSYWVGVFEIDQDGLTLHGLFRTIRVPRDDLLSIGSWALQYRSRAGQRRNWYLAVYWTSFNTLPAVSRRSDEVVRALDEVLAAWSATEVS